MLRPHLAIATFFAILAAITLSGALVVPFIIRAAENYYIDLLSDINRRQVDALARFAEYRLARGIPPEELVGDLNAMLAEAEVDRGFSCVIAKDSRKFVCHPRHDLIGQPISITGATFEGRANRGVRAAFEEAITTEGGGAGLLHLPGGGREVVFMRSLPSVGWVVLTHENTARIDAELASLRWRLIGAFALLGLVIAAPSAYAARRVSARYEATIEAKNRLILAEQEKSEQLLLNILPASVARELKEGRTVIAERHEEVAVLFADLVGFTTLAGRIPPEQLVQLLNRVFSEFDDHAAALGLEKIKTIGDAYMVCGGLPEPLTDATGRVATMALAMVSCIKGLSHETGHALQVRIGIDTGTVVAGVIGKKKFSYDLWGDVVNVASRMESSGDPGRIHVTEAVKKKLEGHFAFAACAPAEIKGKGLMQTHFLGPRLE
jgi:class 3 adenylate cyclase